MQALMQARVQASAVVLSGVLGAILAAGANPTAHAAGKNRLIHAPVRVSEDVLPTPPFDHRLPTVLSSRDRKLYRFIFDAQKAGSWTTADIAIKALQNNVLIGHVNHQRFMHPTHYRSSFRELSGWLANYGDHPRAWAVYRLARSRKPRNYRAPARPFEPSVTPILRMSDDETETSSSQTPGRTRAARRDQARIRSWTARGFVTRALKYLKSSGPNKRLTPPMKAESYSVIARGYYHYQKFDESIAAAEHALAASIERSGTGLWWAGLAAFRLEHYGAARKMFSILARLENESAKQRSAAAFWAARAAMRAHDPQDVSTYLHLAASHPREFYGLLALRALGYPAPVDWSMPEERSDSFGHLLALPAVQRAIGLIEVGQLARAEAELLRLGDLLGPAAINDLLLIGDWLELPSVVQDAAESLFRNEEPLLRASLYPVPGFAPTSGYRVDKALIFSMMHIESRFRLGALSRVGATGLMQLMPATASYISGVRYRGVKRRELYDPSTNIELGQAYIEYLMKHETIGDNLIFVSAAYNGGPGNLKRWRRRLGPIDDPLLFMESLPVRETAGYVEQVLGNLWIYRLRLGTTPTVAGPTAKRTMAFLYSVRPRQ